MLFRSKLQSPARDSIQTEFSICASLLLRVLTKQQSIIQVLDNQNVPWFSIYVSYFYPESSVVKVLVKVEEQYISQVFLKVRPHGWIHSCISINTQTGETNTTFNDQVNLHKERNSPFKESTLRIPEDWSGKILIGKYWYYPTSWIQSLGVVTNVNIFKRSLSQTEMLRITNSINCRYDGDYVSWTQMDWEVTGEDVETYEINYEELCANNFKSYKFILTNLQSWFECRDNCKIGRAHV